MGETDPLLHQPKCLANGSAGFHRQFTALLLKQWLQLWHRKWSTLTIFVICVGIQTLAAWGYLQTLGGTVLPGPFAMMLMIFYGMYVLRISGDLCTEKRDRIREAMRMMGMNDMPYYLSILVFEIAQAGVHAVVAFATGLAMSNVKSQHVESKVLFGAEWGLFIFFLYLLAATFAMAASTLFTSNHGSKIVFVMWGLNVLPAIGSIPTEGLDWKAGWRWLSGFGKFSLELLYSAAYAVGMFFFYCYLDQVIRHGEGRVRPFYFVFTARFWSTVFDSDPTPSYHGIGDNENKINPDVEEETDPLLVSKADRFQCVKTNNLDVTFEGIHGEEIHAVNKLNLTMFEDQIFVLLGHNGAGKTTTMHCLSGLIQPTAGAINAYGLSIPDDIDFVRKSFGFCPQHNQLWKNLTVRDHLKLFARFRNRKLSESELETYLEEIGLKGFMHQRADALSGGQKRKLSVGIAFIGDPKFVILDEPSSGMDTFARRQLWEFLKSRREGRVIMITTHFMDEADALADRVAVMAHGELQAMGSPAFLKKRFGCGYMLTAAPVETHQANDLFNRVREICNAHLGKDDENITFSQQGKETLVRMPFSCRQNIPAILDDLERLKGSLCDSYGISVANLEEVFLKIADGEKDTDLLEKEVSKFVLAKHRDQPTIEPKSNFDPDRSATFAQQFRAMFYRRVRIGLRSKVSTILGVAVPVFALILAAVLTRLMYGPADGSGLGFNWTFESRLDITSPILFGALLMTVSVAFLTVAAADFAVLERGTGVKDFLFINGCGYFVYWFSNTVWDALSAIPWLVFYMIFWLLPFCIFRGVMMTDIGIFLVMFVIFTFSSAFFAYVLSQMVTTPWKSVILCLLFNGLLVALCVLFLVLDRMKEIEKSSLPAMNTGNDVLKTMTQIFDAIGFFFPTYPSGQSGTVLSGGETITSGLMICAAKAGIGNIQDLQMSRFAFGAAILDVWPGVTSGPRKG